MDKQEAQQIIDELRKDLEQQRIKWHERCSNLEKSLSECGDFYNLKLENEQLKKQIKDHVCKPTEKD